MLLNLFARSNSDGTKGQLNLLKNIITLPEEKNIKTKYKKTFEDCIAINAFCDVIFKLYRVDN